MEKYYIVKNKEGEDKTFSDYYEGDVRNIILTEIKELCANITDEEFQEVFAKHGILKWSDTYKKDILKEKAHYLYANVCYELLHNNGEPVKILEDGNTYSYIELYTDRDTEDYLYTHNKAQFYDLEKENIEYLNKEFSLGLDTNREDLFIVQDCEDYRAIWSVREYPKTSDNGICKEIIRVGTSEACDILGRDVY